ncbi:NAD(P)H-hydrate epimerase [Spiroplasma phoeniceum]|uniref:NAD(P)H-hydrate epimerase n=1 Tax=Spiroplasma phoeniceum TaxID=47835 RepID=UPI001FE815C6|nr:NAD(P)H-hydrate epimerase [Spiroplasma phoeniceum]
MPPAIAEIIKKVNESQKYVLASDIPSGIENDSATIPTIAIKANGVSSARNQLYLREINW